MEPLVTGYDAIDHIESSVHDWRVSQLTRLGIPRLLAEVYADRIGLLSASSADAGSEDSAR